MRKISILATASLTLALLAACAPTAAGPVPVAQTEAATCAARGGAMQPVGRMQRLTCVTPYADAGKICRDKADCQGSCILEGNVETTGAVAGTCQKTDVQFGCFAKVVDGKATGAICID